MKMNVVKVNLSKIVAKVAFGVAFACGTGSH